MDRINYSAAGALTFDLRKKECLPCPRQLLRHSFRTRTNQTGMMSSLLEDVVQVVAKWLPAYAPRSKALLWKCLAEKVRLQPPPSVRGNNGSKTPKKPESSQLLAARVEACGSGAVICACLEVTASAAIGHVKALIHKMCPERRRWRQMLYHGHGGAKLKSNTKSLEDYGVKSGDVLVVAHQTRKLSARAFEKLKRDVSIGSLGCELEMFKLRQALETEDPCATMERLRLSPLNCPFWRQAEMTVSLDIKRVYINGNEVRLSILDYAHTLNLKSLSVLEDWTDALYKAV